MGGMPIFLDIKNKKIIVVGGNTAALIKIRNLIEFNANIIVIATEVCKDIIEFENKKLININIKKFDEKDLDGALLVIAAADSETNYYVYSAAKKSNILCNTLDKQNKSDFIFPAHKTCGDITVAISTNGKYPLLAKKICYSIDLNINEKLNYLEEKRQIIIKNIDDKIKVKIILNEILKDEIILSDDYKQKTEKIIARYIK